MATRAPQFLCADRLRSNRLRRLAQGFPRPPVGKQQHIFREVCPGLQLGELRLVDFPHERELIPGFIYERLHCLQVQGFLIRIIVELPHMEIPWECCLRYCRRVGCVRVRQLLSSANETITTVGIILCTQE